MALHTKQRTNVSIDADLLKAARSRREENRKAIQAYNEEVRERGTFSDGLRGF
ncbi:MAG: type II toxin-antitoxin system CcdA family antitoxin [Spirochaetaceae bacterium]